MKKEFTCRMALPSDSATKIAKYLHLTDPYIYPMICADPEDDNWCEFIRQCLSTPGHVYNLEHLAVLLCGEEIVGVACVAPCGVALTITDGIKIPQELRKTLDPVVEGYFLPLIQENLTYSGRNIVNICLDSAYRGQGLGQKLMDFCLEHCGNGDVHLDVISSNTAAIHLYERSGFRISARYMGFTGSDLRLPCYHMIRKSAQ